MVPRNYEEDDDLNGISEGGAYKKEKKGESGYEQWR